MKILKLTLAHYKRLALKDIKYLEMTMESIFQLILGTNGSGKSSVLAELTPLPAVPANFNKGGYKEIEIEHEGVHYRLTSSFKSGARHSFLIVSENKELNPGGTITVQKELVEKYFKITPQLHSIMIGTTNFTTMSPSKRSELITSLSDVDMTYALSVFGKVKTSLRDMQGVIKHLKGRLTAESARLNEISDITELDTEIAVLTQELNWLLSHSSTVSNQNPIKLHELTMEIQGFAQNLLKTVPIPPERQFGFKTPQELDTFIHELGIMIEVSTNTITELGKEHDDLSRLCAQLQTENGVNNLQGMADRANSIRNSLANIPTENHDWVDVDAIEYTRRAAEQCLIDLGTSCHTLAGIKEPECNTPKLYGELQWGVSELQGKITETNNKLSHVTHRIEGIKGIRDVKCPSCTTTFKPGIENLDSLIDEREHYKKESETFHVQLNDMEKRLLAGKTYLDARQHVFDIFKQFPVLTPFFQYLLNDFNIIQRPADIGHAVGKYIVVLDEVTERTVLTSELSDIEKSLKIVEGLDLSGGANLQQRLIEIDKKLNVAIQEKTKFTTQQTQWTAFRGDCQNIMGQVGLLRRKIMDLKGKTTERVDQIRNNLVEENLQVRQMKLSGLTRKQTEHNTLVGIVADLEKDHDGRTEDLETMKAISELLSPSDGLIAEQLLGFINCFVAQMNDIIKQCWTYDLIVKPCGNASGTLDYKFPVEVRTSDNVIGDVSDGSTAQKEIINFAFKLVVMMYSNLNEYPLYLDELGAGFDELHRVNAMSYVRMINDSGRHSQTFMISHYATNHGSFRNADVMVLDGDNIAVPQGHNRHVVIK